MSAQENVYFVISDSSHSLNTDHYKLNNKCNGKSACPQAAVILSKKANAEDLASLSSQVKKDDLSLIFLYSTCTVPSDRLLF